MGKNTLRVAILNAILLMGGTMALPETAHAQSQTQAYHIEAGDLEGALSKFGTESRIQLIYSPELLKGKRSRGLTGNYAPMEALQRLLEGSGLESERVNDRTVVLKKAPAPPKVPASSLEPPTEATETKEEATELETIVVTGTHIRGAGESAGTKVLTFDREEIEQSGYGRLQDFMETLTQNFTGISEDFTGATIGNSLNGTEIQLRGLGPGTTLTLINGQRSPGGGAQGGFTDISNIPVSAIERVEILPDGASAIYGSDAIGGVVNIILRKDLEGAETWLRFGTSSGDANEIQAAQLYGHSWYSGHLLLGYQYTDREPLTWGDRERLLGDQRPYGGTDHRRDSVAQRGGAPGNILNTASQVVYAIPPGQNGTNLTAAQLLPGVTNYQDTSYTALLPSQKMHSVFASISQRFSDRVEMLFDARYSTRDVRLPFAANGAVATVPATNPFYVNPFGGTEPVRVEYDFTADLGPQTMIGTNETFSVGIAPTIELGGEWRLSLSGSYGEDRTDATTINRLNTAAVAAGAAVWTDTNPATALNVFGDGTANNPATLDRIRLPDLFEHVTNSAWSAGVTADGPLFALPGGSAKLAVGAAYHSDRWDSTANGVNSVNGTVDDSRQDRAVFAELTLPLVGKEQGIPLVQSLDLSLAGRYDNYSDVGSTFNPKIGVAWGVSETLRLRGTWGTSFRAPPFYLSNLELRPPARQSLSLLDPTPTSPANRTNVLSLSGSVRDMKEETAELWTAGFDLTPVDRLNMSGTYFNIRYDGRIGSPINFNTVLVNEEQYAGTGLVIINPTQAQIDAICNSPDFENPCVGPYGAIIDGRRRNIAVTQMSGVDVDVNYGVSTRIGDINAGLGGTYLFEYEEAISPGSPVQEVLDTYQKPLALRLRGTASWSLGAWTANAAVNYSGSYKVANTAVAKRIGSWTTLDLGVGYEFAPNNSDLSNGAQIRLSATNVFNKLPPPVDVKPGYDTANGNMIGRTISVQVAKEW